MKLVNKSNIRRDVNASVNERMNIERHLESIYLYSFGCTSNRC